MPIIDAAERTLGEQQRETRSGGTRRVCRSPPSTSFHKQFHDAAARCAGENLITVEIGETVCKNFIRRERASERTGGWQCRRPGGDGRLEAVDGDTTTAVGGAVLGMIGRKGGGTDGDGGGPDQGVTGQARM